VQLLCKPMFLPLDPILCQFDLLYIPMAKSTIMQLSTQELCSEGVQTIQLRTEDRENGDLEAVIRGSGGSCNLVQEISFHVVNFS
jgi:hypothetical protein